MLLYYKKLQRLCPQPSYRLWEHSDVGALSFRQFGACQSATRTGVCQDGSTVHDCVLARHHAGRGTTANDVLEHHARDRLAPAPGRRALGGRTSDWPGSDGTLDQPPLGAAPRQVADQEHADHELGIDRRLPHATVVPGLAVAHKVEIQRRVDVAQRVLGGRVSSRQKMWGSISVTFCRAITALPTDPNGIIESRHGRSFNHCVLHQKRPFSRTPGIVPFSGV